MLCTLVGVAWFQSIDCKANMVTSLALWNHSQELCPMLTLLLIFFTDRGELPHVQDLTGEVYRFHTPEFLHHWNTAKITRPTNVAPWHAVTGVPRYLTT